MRATILPLAVVLTKTLRPLCIKKQYKEDLSLCIISTFIITRLSLLMQASSHLLSLLYLYCTHCHQY